MKKSEFVKWLDTHKDSIGMRRVVVGQEEMTEYAVGCFFDNKSEYWKVYINTERGRHRIRLETKDEDAAFEKLKSLVEYVIENNQGGF